MSKKLKVFFWIFLIIDVLFLTILVLLYGPLRGKIIDSHLSGKNSFLTYALYNEEIILDRIKNNLDYDSKYATFNSEEKAVSNEEELSILERKEDNEYYKLLNIKVGGYPAYLAVIYDASMVKLITSSKFNTGNSQENVLTMCKREKGIVCINGGMFVDYGTGSDTPMGYLIKSGKIVWSDNNKKANLIGFDNNDKLVLVNATGDEALEMGIRDALEFGPFLIKDGVVTDGANASVGGYYGAARVAIAQRKDGIVLFLVSDGRHGNGASMKDVTETFQKYGAYNAANLDGGASSQLVVDGKLVNNPINIYGQTIYGGRRVVSGFGLIKE